MKFILDCHCKLHLIIHWDRLRKTILHARWRALAPASKKAWREKAQAPVIRARHGLHQTFLSVPLDAPAEEAPLKIKIMRLIVLHPCLHRWGVKCICLMSLSLFSCCCTAGGGGGVNLARWLWWLLLLPFFGHRRRIAVHRKVLLPLGRLFWMLLVTSQSTCLAWTAAPLVPSSSASSLKQLRRPSSKSSPILQAKGSSYNHEGSLPSFLRLGRPRRGLVVL